MNKDNSSGVGESQVSGVGQTASIGRSTSVSSGAAKVFREFKWGLLTLFLLMVVVVGLVYDGGAKKKTSQAAKPADPLLDVALDGATATPPAPGNGALLGPVGPTTGTESRGFSEAPNPGIITDFNAVPPIPNAPANSGVVAPPVPANPNVGAAAPLPYGETNLSQVMDPPPPKPNPPAAPAAAKVYKVQSGDTLSSIAQTLKLGKGGLKALIAANKTTLPNPDRLKVGMTLNVPESAPKADTPAAKVAMAENTPKGDKAAAVPIAPVAEDYTVQSGDTLERIARKVFNDGRRWQEIHNWNRDQLPDPARLRVGQVLKIKQGTKTSSSKNKISEAEAGEKTEDKAAIVELPKTESDAKDIAISKSKPAAETHSEPRVEVMSASSSAFAP